LRRAARHTIPAMAAACWSVMAPIIRGRFGAGCSAVQPRYVSRERRCSGARLLLEGMSDALEDQGSAPSARFSTETHPTTRAAPLRRRGPSPAPWMRGACSDRPSVRHT
jgi:hypothetical protein